jgi:hypothetical protein
MAANETGKRYRINISTTSKGLKSFDCTIELSGDGVTLEEVLAESDRLVAELDRKYPAPEAA